jgi:hypothetical protein
LNPPGPYFSRIGVGVVCPALRRPALGLAEQPLPVVGDPGDVRIHGPAQRVHHGGERRPEVAVRAPAEVRAVHEYRFGKQRVVLEQTAEPGTGRGIDQPSQHHVAVAGQPVAQAVPVQCGQLLRPVAARVLRRQGRSSSVGGGGRRRGRQGFLARQGPVRFQPLGEGRVVGGVLDGLGLEGDGLSNRPLPGAQGGQVVEGLGVGRGQAEGGAEGGGGLGVLVAKGEQLALVVPQGGVVHLGGDGPADDFLGQVEVAVGGGLPGLFR